MEKKLSPYHYRVRLKAVISVVNHDRMNACHARKVPAWCKRKLLGGPEQVYCLCRKKDDSKQGVVPWQVHGNCKAGQALA